ncbi:MAG TPA: FAD-dependent oxidoreductase [Gemmatimonadaceae bacterium]|nr:FAD-dependent oxidoreductase [Gemmatimonadaceae bacterium]
MSGSIERNARPEILVIGAGIAGIAAALRIRALNDSCGITLADSAARLGGKIAGDVVDGCVVDGGADVCIGSKLRATSLFDALSLGTRVIRVNPDNLPTYELRDGELCKSPTTFDGELLTFREGLRELVDVACAALRDVTVHTNAVAESIQRTDDGRWVTHFADGTSLIADAAIVAVPARAAMMLLSSLPVPAAKTLEGIAYPATSTVTMAWNADDVQCSLSGTGYLVTDPSSAVSACTWTSSKNPTHAPRGTVIVRGYVRGCGLDAVSLVRAEVASTLGVTAPPLFTRVYEWPAGIAVYPPDHDENVTALGDALAALPGLFIAGSTFHGIGIPDCIHSGERAGASAVTYLAARQTEEAA